ncbi:MAG: lycopene cyclase domain-containing protein [Actinomycetota bacterium]|nr:lycopene cyclase domain-containing protein [Actinomycetota bacterium]
MEFDRFQYLILMGLCVLITLPLEFILGTRVWRSPQRLLWALVPTVLIFTLWDLIAIARNNWAYNPAYITRVRLPGDLPIEELVFFIVIPICALLTFETVRRVLTEPDDVKASLTRWMRGDPAEKRAGRADKDAP